MRKILLVTAFVFHILPGWLYRLRLALFSLFLAAMLLAQGSGPALASDLPVGQCINCPVQGPTVVIITHMSARPGASPSLLLAGFVLLALLFGLAWLRRRGHLHV